MTVAASPSEIRQWARTQGMTVGNRGRLSPETVAAYAVDQSQSQQPAATTTSATKAGAGSRIVVRPAPGAIGITRTISARAR